MFTRVIKKVFGSRNDRLVKKYSKMVKHINQLEAQLIHLNDETLSNKTKEFKTRFQKGESLQDLLPEAFAVCREASRRVLNMRHFDVQLIGGMALHAGKIPEMRTGEGKTLVGTLAAYLNALAGRGVHIVTVNEYLAERDAQWMGQLYEFLGMSVGINLSSLSPEEKRQAYLADITYSTNNELGFDYLRDNMVYDVNQRVQRDLNFAIVDEVDSILIDEARTPLIISGMAEDHTDMYAKMNDLPPLLKLHIEDTKTQQVTQAGDFTIDEKNRQIFLTEQGHENTEQILQHWGLLKKEDNLYAPQNISLMHHIYAALKAHHFYIKDKNYVLQDGEVVIVDEFTGRLMAGRRWSEGLHQAVEAKEKVRIQPENQTMASITFQNYFRMYKKIAGMTGTADTEAYEFQEIYGLETLIIPPNKPTQRKDFQDQIFKTREEKFKAVVRDIQRCHQQSQPVLVGTASIEASEYLSELLHKANLQHEVLNAKNHEREAEIIAQAGKLKAITIATNMAGRGTDIVLGGNIEKQVQHISQDDALSSTQKAQIIKVLKDDWFKEHEDVKNMGGLHVIGTERHESRRIDNQLRGRAGRQGDKGSSRFYLSLEDDLLRIFGGDKMKAIFTRLRIEDHEAIEAGMLSRSIESAQRKVEAHNFDTRKQLLQFDDVSNEQRREIYDLRNDVLEQTQITSMLTNLLEDVMSVLVCQYVPPQSLEEQWRLKELEALLKNEWRIATPLVDYVEKSSSIDDEQVLEFIMREAKKNYRHKKTLVGEETFAQFEKNILLSSLDQFWREHLAHLDHLRQGIYLRGYAQKDPKQEYKKEAYELFNQLLIDIKTQVIRTLLNVRIQSEEEQAEEMAQAAPRKMVVGFADDSRLQAAQIQAQAQTAMGNVDDVDVDVRVDAENQSIPKVGRNQACPCGSGQKYKDCHGKIA